MIDLRLASDRDARERCHHRARVEPHPRRSGVNRYERAGVFLTVDAR